VPSLYIATLIVLFVVGQVTDQWIFRHFTYPSVYEHGWGRMLRGAGYLPLWAVVALALVLHDWVPRARRTWRQARVLWYGLALGCGLTRVASGAHFMSDAVFAALVGYVVTLIFWRCPVEPLP